MKKRLTELCKEYNIPFDEDIQEINNKKIQNFVVDLNENEKLFWDFIHAPCIMLLAKYQSSFKYCHFDEDNLHELKGFIDFIYQEGNKKIALFGGWGSQNIPKVIKYAHNKKLKILAQKDFVKFSPVEEITLYKNRFYFLGKNSNKKDYSFIEMHNLLN